ncbi:hypothetical protein D0T53_12540 [Dysgonomonas sp. 216]|uniref:hypothetical protein n=1 Tax=Dysgonomonas sp. 216 TaxID=2302934 RepID=UPI0013D47D7A|nr:hypothetical protein [Dysgonomonas sp. 216]NDW19732.1 hypothetical protein [Dysgonomonas sp. 216]
MKKIVLGALVGAAAGYCIRKLQEQGKFDSISDKMHNFKYKAKRNANIAMDLAKSEAAYVKDKIGYNIEKGKESLDKLTSK